MFAFKAGKEEMKLSENFRVLRFRVCVFVCTLENREYELSLSLLNVVRYILYNLFFFLLHERFQVRDFFDRAREERHALVHLLRVDL